MTTPSPPYLVIREGLSFWVERRPISDVSATLQSFREGCYSHAVCYDGTGNLWPIEHAALKIQPSLVHRLFPWRELPVEIRVGSPIRAEVSEVSAKIEDIIRVDSEVNENRRPSQGAYIERLKTAATARELIQLVARIV